MEISHEEKNLAIFLTIIVLFVLIGMIFIYSSSSVFALERFNSAHYFVKKQLIGFVIGLIGLLICRIVPLKLIKLCTPFAFLFFLVLTILPTISSFGKIVNGSRRWIYISGMSLQPSEFLKMAFIAYISYLIVKKTISSELFS